MKPASCDMLLSRTSTMRLTPAFCKVTKNRSADFFVKPIVNIFVPKNSVSLQIAENQILVLMPIARTTHQPFFPS